MRLILPRAKEGWRWWIAWYPVRMKEGRDRYIVWLSVIDRMKVGEHWHYRFRR